MRFSSTFVMQQTLSNRVLLKLTSSKGKFTPFFASHGWNLRKTDKMRFSSTFVNAANPLKSCSLKTSPLQRKIYSLFCISQLESEKNRQNADSVPFFNVAILAIF